VDSLADGVAVVVALPTDDPAGPTSSRLSRAHGLMDITVPASTATTTSTMLQNERWGRRFVSGLICKARSFSVFMAMA
jgi:hypothetical protein